MSLVSALSFVARRATHVTDRSLASGCTFEEEPDALVATCAKLFVDALNDAGDAAEIASEEWEAEDGDVAGEDDAAAALDSDANADAAQQVSASALFVVASYKGWRDEPNRYMATFVYDDGSADDNADDGATADDAARRRLSSPRHRRRPRDRRRLAASVDTSSGVTVAARAVSTSDSSETAIYAVTVVVDDGRFHGTKDGMSIMITGYAHEDDTYITDTTFHALETAGGGFESGDTYSFSVATDVNIALITSITLTSSGASHRKQSPRCRFARETRSRKAIDDQTTV